MANRILNLGLLAHVDAGKTSLTENLLFQSKAIRKRGSVDKGSTVSDSLELERDRGISIRTSSSSFIFNETLINLIDTPGHSDFSAEVERCLSVIDGAVVLISAVEGVQAHTKTLWYGLNRLHIPRLIFVNKTDREGADLQKVIQQIRSELKMPFFPMNSIVNEGSSNIEWIDLFSTKTLTSFDENLKELALETLAGLDDEFLEIYLEENRIEEDMLLSRLYPFVRNNEICPVFAGSAKFDLGTSEMLNSFEPFFAKKPTNLEKEVAAFVYKVEHDKTFGRLAHVRLFSGKLFPRDTLWNETQGIEMKATRINRQVGGKLEDQSYLSSGEVGIVSGMASVQAGDILGNTSLVPIGISLQESVLSVQVKPIKNEDSNGLGEALVELNSEDPNLNFKWFKAENEMHLSLIGPMQIQILEQVLKSRFQIDTVFSSPEVIYKETPLSRANGRVVYTMPKPCWAVMTFNVEPGEEGSGVCYTSQVSVDKIHNKYQNEIELAIPKALKQGVRGWEVTDLKIILVDGEDHEIHSRPGDFILATPIGILKALKNAGTQLLEPYYFFEIQAPEEFLGPVVSDLTKMRARFDSPVFNAELFDIRGEVPVAESLKYSIRLNSSTGGQGKIRLRFGGYQICPEGKGVDRPYKGVNPLNQSQWILQRRGAFKADDRSM